MGSREVVNPSRDKLERSARRAIEEARDPRKAAALAAAGTAAAAAGFGIKRLRDRDGHVFDSDEYRLLDGEPVGPGLRRAILAQVDDAVAQLRGDAGTEPAEAIHEARKDMKTIGRALRLVRDHLGDDVWRRENDHYRRRRRTLSSFRDAEILIEALDGLGERFGPSARTRFAGLREQLERELLRTDGGSIERAMATPPPSCRRTREDR
jgi:hypothetical protein